VPSSSQRQLTLNPIPLRRDLVSWSALGAKLGAILCGFLRTAMDVDGIESPLFRAVWTVVDAHGHGLEIYGSEGWGFESLRACRRPLALQGVSVIGGHRAHSQKRIKAQAILDVEATAPDQSHWWADRLHINITAGAARA
jgi:hypothetical protein